MGNVSSVKVAEVHWEKNIREVVWIVHEPGIFTQRYMFGRWSVQAVITAVK